MPHTPRIVTKRSPNHTCAPRTLLCNACTPAAASAATASDKGVEGRVGNCNCWRRGIALGASRPKSYAKTLNFRGGLQQFPRETTTAGEEKKNIHHRGSWSYAGATMLPVDMATLDQIAPGATVCCAKLIDIGTKKHTRRATSAICR